MNSVLLITGGAGHIGRATCEAMAPHECDIVVVDKNKQAADDFSRELQQSFGVKTLALGADLQNKESFAEIADAVSREFGRLDYLVNNAAFYDDMPGWGVPYEEEGYDAWQAVMQVNLLAPFFLIQSMTPLLRKSSVASVVNISSIYGMVGPDFSLYEGTEMTNPAAYAASKGGLNQITSWLSTVLAPDIRVNTVTPGGVERGQNDQFLQRYNKKTPLGRMATEEDIAGAIEFLLLPASRYITGHNLVVDGGWTAW